MFAFSVSDSTISGHHFAVSDRNGFYYRRYTPGTHVDGYPRCSPCENTILINRRDLNNHSMSEMRVMILVPETGGVKEYVHPGAII